MASPGLLIKRRRPSAAALQIGLVAFARFGQHALETRPPSLRFDLAHAFTTIISVRPQFFPTQPVVAIREISEIEF